MKKSEQLSKTEQAALDRAIAQDDAIEDIICPACGKSDWDHKPRGIECRECQLFIYMPPADREFVITDEMCDEADECIVWLERGSRVIPAQSICPQVVAAKQGVEQEKGKEEQP